MAIIGPVVVVGEGEGLIGGIEMEGTGVDGATGVGIKISGVLVDGGVASLAGCNGEIITLAQNATKLTEAMTNTATIRTTM
jgi:hypothetical protein